MGINSISPNLSFAGAGAAGKGNGDESQIRSLEQKLKDLTDGKKKAHAARDEKKVRELEKQIRKVEEQIEKLKREQKKEGEEGQDPEEAGRYGRADAPGSGSDVDTYA